MEAPKVSHILIVGAFLMAFLLLFVGTHMNALNSSKEKLRSFEGFNDGKIISDKSIHHNDGLRSKNQMNINLNKATTIISNITESSSTKIHKKNERIQEEEEKEEKKKKTKIYVSNHPILALGDIDIVNTTFDIMLQWYGEADGPGTCSQDFGNSLITRWRETKQNYCTTTFISDLTSSYSSLSSSVKENENNNDNYKVSEKDTIFKEISNNILHTNIDCYLLRQTGHAGQGDNLCVIKDISVNIGIFHDKLQTNNVIKKYVNSQHEDLPYIHYNKGFTQGTCIPNEKYWQTSYMPGWNADWTTKSYEKISNILLLSSTSNNLICHKWITHPVIIIQRDTFANFFHNSEDFWNIFIAMSVLQLKQQDIQIFLTDLYPEGPFWDMWSKVYTGKYPVLTAWDLSQKYKHNRKNLSEFRICFKQLIIGIYGPAAPFTLHISNTPCSHSAIMRAYSDYVIRKLHLQASTHYAQSQPSNSIIITYLARRASSVWPEKKYCNITHSYFHCQYWENFGIRSLGRMISNENEFIDIMKTLEKITKNKKEELIKVIFQVKDYNLLTFQEQIQVDLETDILIGPHGAGLTHNVFMRDRAVLIELSISGSGGLRHFHNLAKWYGRPYIGVPCQGNTLDVQSIKSIVLNTIYSIDIHTY